MSRILAQAQQWHLVDARNMVVGRLATHLSRLLMGKHKPLYMPNSAECGDHVVVVNAAHAVLTGSKFESKVYYWHTGYPGGLKQTTPKRLHERGKPEQVLLRAVNGMLPKNRLRKHRRRRLRVFAEDEHPFAEQLAGATPLVFEDAISRLEETRVWGWADEDASYDEDYVFEGADYREEDRLAPDQWLVDAEEAEGDLPQA